MKCLHKVLTNAGKQVKTNIQNVKTKPRPLSSIHIGRELAMDHFSSWGALSNHETSVSWHWLALWLLTNEKITPNARNSGDHSIRGDCLMMKFVINLAPSLDLINRRTLRQ